MCVCVCAVSRYDWKHTLERLEILITNIKFFFFFFSVIVFQWWFSFFWGKIRFAFHFILQCFNQCFNHRHSTMMILTIIDLNWEIASGFFSLISLVWLFVVEKKKTSGISYQRSEKQKIWPDKKDMTLWICIFNTQQTKNKNKKKEKFVFL